MVSLILESLAVVVRIGQLETVVVMPGEANTDPWIILHLRQFNLVVECLLGPSAQAPSCCCHANAPGRHFVPSYYAQYSSLSNRFMSLPVGVRGNFSRKSTLFGVFRAERCLRQKAMSSRSNCGPASVNSIS